MKCPATISLPALLVAVAMVVSLGGPPANADPKPAKADPNQKFDNNGRRDYGPSGPNSSYMQGPNTRIYVTKRSWLDAGTEVLPGDRKFMDYAYPPGPSFGVRNNNRPTERQPLDPDSDLGGGPRRFPLY
jgi:hypothetical protein